MVDSSQKTWRYLDAHLVLPMIDFLEDNKLAAETEIMQCRIKAVSATGMIDYLIELYQDSKLTVPSDLIERKAQITVELEAKQAQLRPLLEVVQAHGVEAIKQISLADFCLKYNLSADILDVTFEYARLSYHIGDYKTSSELLKIYRLLTSSTETMSSPTERQMRAMWGSIASYIAQNELSAASELILKLVEFFENSTLPKDKFSYGASGLWLIHWAVLVSLKSKNVDLLSFMVKDKFLNIMSISAPYLWRYISALIILSPYERIQSLPVTDIANLISKDADASRDPINEALVELLQNFNLENKLHLSKAAKGDFYLDALADELDKKAGELRNQIKAKLYQ